MDAAWCEYANVQQHPFESIKGSDYCEIACLSESCDRSIFQLPVMPFRTLKPCSATQQQAYLHGEGPEFGAATSLDKVLRGAGLSVVHA